MPYVGRATECCYITSQSPGVCRTRALIYEKGPAFAAPTPRWSLLGKLDDFDDESNCRARETNGGEDQHYYISCYINHLSFSTDWSSKWRSEEHKSELQSIMRISYADVCVKE